MASLDLRTGAESDAVVKEFDMPVRSGNIWSRQRIAAIYAHWPNPSSYLLPIRIR